MALAHIGHILFCSIILDIHNIIAIYLVVDIAALVLVELLILPEFIPFRNKKINKQNLK